MLRLRCCCCYARKNRDMGYAIEMAIKIRPGYRCEALSMVGRVPAAREKSRPIVLLGLCIRGKLQDKVSANQDAPIGEPFAPRVSILRGCVLDYLVHRP